MKPPEAAPRFLTLDQVAEELNISQCQATALLRRGDIRAFKMGAGRGQWRIERSQLEEDIARTYADAEDWIDEHPLVERLDDESAEGAQ